MRFMRYSLLLLAALPLAAQDDPREVAPFIDGVMEAQQKAHHFAGAVVVIVRDG